MRKRLVSKKESASDEQWLDLEAVAQVEITSEEAEHPIESALTGSGSGWRALHAGEQVIRVVFDEPRALRRIHVAFDEPHEPRTQEFVLQWSQDRGRSYKEIVRQRYTFSPPGTTNEAEDYAVELDHVSALELRIVPDISKGASRASLRALRLA